MPPSDPHKFSYETLRDEIQELKVEMKEFRGDFFEKVSEIHARVSRESNKTAALMALWSISSLIGVALIYKLFDLTTLISRMGIK